MHPRRFAAAGYWLRAGSLLAALAGCAAPPPLAARCSVAPAASAAAALAASNTETLAASGPADCALRFQTSDAEYGYIVPYPRARVTVPPTHGTASVRKTDVGVTVAYAPEPGFVGPDRFTIRVEPGSVDMTVDVEVPR